MGTKKKMPWPDPNHVIRLRAKDMGEAEMETCPTCEAGRRRNQAKCRLCKGTGQVPVIK